MTNHLPHIPIGAAPANPTLPPILAASLALRGLRVAVVDTDIQSPGIHTLFASISVHFTLNDYLWGKCGVREAALDVTSGVVDEAGVCQVPAGGQVFLVPSSIKTGEIARILKEKYDVEDLNNGFHDLCHSWISISAD